MKLVLKKNNIQDWTASFIISILMGGAFTLSGTTDAYWIFLIFLISSVYIAKMILKTNLKALNYLATPASVWFLGIATLIFLYGSFGQHKGDYSFIYHFTNIIYVMFICITLYYKRKNLLQVYTNACVITLVYETIYLVINDYHNLINNFADIITGNSYYRFGTTGAGNVNVTSMTYVFLLIPIIYQMFQKKNLKRNWLILVVGTLVIVLTGSKKGIIALLLTLLCMIFIYKKAKVMNLIKWGTVTLFLMVVIYSVPLFHNLIWVRLEGMIQLLLMSDFSGESSTVLRMRYIVLALKNFWEKPIFGHGWHSFAYLYGNGAYSHCNITEILFSCGLFGLIVYYWFPICLLLKKEKRKSSIKSLIFSYIIVLLFFDIGAVTFYSAIFAYIGFALVYLLMRYSSVDNTHS